jgi:hypothetical protein
MPSFNRPPYNSAAATRWNVGPEDVMLLEKVFEVEK